MLLSRAVPEKTTTAPQLGKITQSDTDCTGSDSLVSASHVDPSGVTHAYAECAQQRGAEINKYVWVHDITRAADGSWDLHVHDTRKNEDLGIINC